MEARLVLFTFSLQPSTFSLKSILLMAKREKVILVIMAVIVVFGAYNFLFGSTAKTKPSVSGEGVAETNKFIADVAQSFQGDASEANLFIINHAQADWTQDPFWHIRVQPEAQPQVVASIEESKPKAAWVYTGYLEMGEEKLAIIDGAEYEAGDELSRGGPVIKSIDSRRVIIGNPGTADETILPLKETK